MWEFQNGGGFLPHELFDHDIVSKTLPGNVFSPTITHIKISEKSMKFFFLKFWHFFNFDWFLCMFSLLNYVLNWSKCHEILFMMCLVNKTFVSTKCYEVWKLWKVFSCFVETLSILKEPIYLSIILFNQYLLQFCT